jgi:hypothetical protein
MRKTAAPPPIITVRIRFTSQPSTQPDTQPAEIVRNERTVTMSDEEIVRRLKVIRHSPDSLRNGRKIPSINGIATAVGLSRDYIYKIASGLRTPGPNAAAALSSVLKNLSTDIR